MNVIVSNPALIAVKGLGEEDRRRVHAWFDHLRNWDRDPQVQKNSTALLPEEKGTVYVLRTTSDVRIFYVVTTDGIVVLDVARKGDLRTTAPGAQ